MIRVLGAKRILTIVALLALNALMAATLYFYLMPEKIKKNRELSSLRGQISTVQTDIGRMQIEFDQLAVQQAQFEKLQKRGFFSTQGRRVAEKVLQRIQQEAGVVGRVTFCGVVLVHQTGAVEFQRQRTLAIGLLGQ